MVAGLAIAPDLELPLDAVTETFAILAKRGTGKSNAAVVMAEEMFDHGLPWVAVDPKGDWWGIRAAGAGDTPGLAVLVLGGEHGDVPLEPTAGQLVADLIVDHRLTCVLDVSEMSKADQRRFLTAFGDRLYRRNRQPLHVFCEEADEYVPQMVRGEDARLVEVFERLVKKGRFRGIGMTLITQRSASLNKNVLTQIETLIPMRTPSPQDRKAVRDWVDVHSDGAAAVDELPSLANGEAWVFSPHWLGQLVKIRFRRRRTFDSGATPKVGETPRAPAALADVDVAALQAAMSESIETVKADDPASLRAEVRGLKVALVDANDQIQDLTRQLAATPDPGVVVMHDVVKPFLRSADQLLERIAAIERRVRAIPTHLGLPTEGNQGKPTTRSSAPRATQTSSTSRRARDAGPSTTEKPSAGTPAGHAPREDPADAPPHLKAGARRLLDTLARQHPARVTRAQLGTLAKFKVTGGTFQTYWSTLKRHGLVDELDGLVGLTTAGAEYVDLDLTPLSTDQLLAQWRSVLKAGARDMLDVLVDLHPDSTTRAELAAQVGLSVSGGTFQTYLSTLRRNGLAVVVGADITAADALFLAGDPS